MHLINYPCSTPRHTPLGCRKVPINGTAGGTLVDSGSPVSVFTAPTLSDDQKTLYV